MTGLVVALVGNRPRCGKTTVAKFMVQEFDFVKKGVADPIRKMMSTFDLDDEEIGGSLKDVPNKKLLGITPRRMMQTLGREVPLAMDRPEYWAEMWFARTSLWHGTNISIVVDDHRYPHERAWFERAALKRNVFVVGINRPGGEEYHGATHAAENQKLNVDFTIFNSGSVRDLRFKVMDTIGDLVRRIAA